MFYIKSVVVCTSQLSLLSTNMS